MKLRARFLHDVEAMPSIADDRPMGSGPTNRHGMPRLPPGYAWKGAKWISKIEVLEQDHPGFWEQRGYSNTAYPWRNDRYSR